MEWQPIETAPKDGSVFVGVSLDPARPFPERNMRWGVASRPEENYVCNAGKAWFMNEDGRHLAPRPTHWRPTPPDGQQPGGVVAQGGEG